MRASPRRWRQLRATLTVPQGFFVSPIGVLSMEGLLELSAEGRIVTGSNVDLAGALAAGGACRRARNRTRQLRIFVQRQPVGTPSFGCCCKIAWLLKNSFHEIRRNKVASGCPINDVPIFLDIFYPPIFRCFEESRALNSHSPITFIDQVLGIVV
jgi:hypothetical protein